MAAAFFGTEPNRTGPYHTGNGGAFRRCRIPANEENQDAPTVKPVATCSTERTRCANREANREARRKCDQHDLDELTEIGSRLNLIGKMLAQVDDLDQVERGTLARMIGNEADGIFTLIETFETRLGE